MLHIANGDSIAGSLIHSTVPGQKIAFQEDLTSGPTPAGLSTSDWLRLRADFLIRAYEPEERDVLLELTEQQSALESQAQHQEIVLWFAHDFNCQVHLINLLNHFGGQGLNRDRLSLICIGEFPGVDPFICLGQLDSQKLGSLFDWRKQVTDEEFDLAHKAWAAYCSADPSDIEFLTAADDTRALPFLAGALRLHLARFPSRKNGLGLIENWALEQVSKGEEKFASLFVRFTGQYPLYGLGDAQFWRVLNRMSDCAQPLIRITGVPYGATLESITWGPVNVEITPVGSRVLDGRDDFIELNGIDQWLGGVHLESGKNEWRLDSETGRIRHN
jgi:hypothetical protein